MSMGCSWIMGDKAGSITLLSIRYSSKYHNPWDLDRNQEPPKTRYAPNRSYDVRMRSTYRAMRFVDGSWKGNT